MRLALAEQLLRKILSRFKVKLIGELTARLKSITHEPFSSGAFSPLEHELFHATHTTKAAVRNNFSHAFQWSLEIFHHPIFSHHLLDICSLRRDSFYEENHLNLCFRNKIKTLERLWGVRNGRRTRPTSLPDRDIVRMAFSRMSNEENCYRCAKMLVRLST